MLLLLLACTGSPDVPTAEPDPVEEPAQPAAPQLPFDVPVPDLGDDPCAAAWTELDAFATPLAVKTGKPPTTDQATFLAACAKLPEPARPCMSNRYMLAKQAECDELLASVPKGVVDELRDALAGPRGGRKVDGRKGSR